MRYSELVVTWSNQFIMHGDLDAEATPFDLSFHQLLSPTTAGNRHLQQKMPVPGSGWPHVVPVTSSYWGAPREIIDAWVAETLLEEYR